MSEQRTLGWKTSERTRKMERAGQSREGDPFLSDGKIEMGARWVAARLENR